MQELKVFSNASQIRAAHIPDDAVDELARSILTALKKRAQEPEFMQKFEAWKLKRELQKGGV